MKAVLISIQPKWVEKIVRGEKTVEVRKTRPKCEVPFKCYIYETKDKRFENMGYCWSKGECFKHHIGKVIGEFICDRIRCEREVADGLVDIGLESTSCVSARELVEYANGNVLYSWHISDLVVYDEPRELNEFERACPDSVRSCAMCRHSGYSGLKCSKRIKPPQSWCYVEVWE